MALTDQQKDNARIMRAQGETAERIAEHYGVKPGDVGRATRADERTDSQPAE